jgi:hypothetical protein
MPQDEERRLAGEALLAGEHVPDRVREPPGDVDLRDLRAALLAEPALGGAGSARGRPGP